MLKYPNYVILLFFLLMLIPFVLIKDVYPFYRFGMFAEPLPNNEVENFLITYQNEQGDTVVFCGMDFEIAESKIATWMRNYFYRGEASLLLQRLKTLRAGKTSSWKLYRIKTNLQRSDTTLVAELAE